MAMATRRKSPQETLAIRRLPAKGDKVQITAEVTRVGPGEDSRWDKLTIRIPGYSVPVTAYVHDLLGGDDD
jgi:hypothetical protein